MHDADDDLPPPPETGGVKGSSSSTPANMTPLSATNLGSAADTPAARSGTKRKWPPVEEGQTYEYECQGTEGKVGGVDTLPLKGRKVIAKCVQVKDGLAMRSETEGWEYHPSTSSADNHFNFLRSAVSHLTKTPSKKIRGPAITKFFQKSAAGVREPWRLQSNPQNICLLACSVYDLSTALTSTLCRQAPCRHHPLCQLLHQAVRRIWSLLTPCIQRLRLKVSCQRHSKLWNLETCAKLISLWLQQSFSHLFSI